MTYAADAVLSLPIQGGLLGGVLAICGIFMRFMQQARKDGYVLAHERADDATAQRQRNSDEIGRLLERVTALEEENREQRSLKHDTINRLAIANLLLDTIRPLADSCTCGALAPVEAILERRHPG